MRYHPGLPDATPSGAFYGVVTRDFAVLDPSCPNLVRQAYSQIISGWNAGSSQRAQVLDSLRVCAPPEGKNAAQQLRVLNLWIENAFAGLGMENVRLDTSRSCRCARL